MRRAGTEKFALRPVIKKQDYGFLWNTLLEMKPFGVA
jgi:hypothetical protein